MALPQKKRPTIKRGLSLAALALLILALIQVFKSPTNLRFDFLLSQGFVGIKSPKLRRKCQEEDLQITKDFSPNETSKKYLQTRGYCRNSCDATGNETPTTLYQWAPNTASLSEYERYTQVHNAPFPACMAGQWVNKPEQAFFLSQKYLQCLDQERNGNYYNPNLWLKTDDPAKLTKHSLLLKNAVSNSSGIFNASDSWLWQPNVPGYEMICYSKSEHKQYCTQISTVLSNRTIFLVGGSLTRQWGQAMRCKIIYVLDKYKEVVKKMAHCLQMHTEFDNGNLLKKHWGSIPKGNKVRHCCFQLWPSRGESIGRWLATKVH